MRAEDQAPEVGADTLWEPWGTAAAEIPAALRPIILPYNGVMPKIAEDVFLAPGAVIVGDVEIGAGASVWFHVTIRGDAASVRIGARSNVQDGAVLHVDPNVP